MKEIEKGVEEDEVVNVKSVLVVVGREESWYDSSASCSVQPASVSEPVRSIMGRLDV